MYARRTQMHTHIFYTVKSDSCVTRRLCQSSRWSAPVTNNKILNKYDKRFVFKLYYFSDMKKFLALFDFDASVTEFLRPRFEVLGIRREIPAGWRPFWTVFWEVAFLSPVDSTLWSMGGRSEWMFINAIFFARRGFDGLVGEYWYCVLGGYSRGCETAFMIGW